MLRPVSGKAIKCSRFDQAFDRFLIDLMDIYVIDKLENVPRQAFFLPRLHDGVNDSLSDVLDAEQAEPDLSVLYREFLAALVDVGRQDFDFHFLAVPDIFRDLGRVADHAGHQRSHEFHRIIILQVSGLISQ